MKNWHGWHKLTNCLEILNEYHLRQEGSGLYMLRYGQSADIVLDSKVFYIGQSCSNYTKPNEGGLARRLRMVYFDFIQSSRSNHYGKFYKKRQVIHPEFDIERVYFSFKKHPRLHQFNRSYSLENECKLIQKFQSLNGQKPICNTQANLS